MKVNIEDIIEIIKKVIYFENLSADTELIKSSLLDSFDMISLISELSYTYKIEIGIMDIDPKNFETANAIFKMIKEIEKRKKK